MSISMDKIGDRWERFADVLAEGLENYSKEFDDREREFMDDMAGKFAIYKENTFVSTTQLNWLNRIEQAVIDLRGGRSRTRSRR